MHSEPGVGSTFGVDLPTIHPSVAAELEKAEEGPRRHGRGSWPSSSTTTRRPASSSPARSPRPASRSSRRAPAAEGQELAFQRQPSVIFLDLRLPDRSGTAVLETLQADLRTRATPIIVYTAQPLTPGLHPLLGSAAAVISKDHQSRGDVLDALRRGLSRAGFAMPESSDG